MWGELHQRIVMIMLNTKCLFLTSKLSKITSAIVAIYATLGSTYCLRKKFKMQVIKYFPEVVVWHFV